MSQDIFTDFDNIQKRVVLVDYLSESDENGKPIGHRIKVANEYIEMLKDTFDLYIYANDSVLPYFKIEKKCRFKHIIRKDYSDKKRKLLYLLNIKEIFKDNRECIIWFFAPDIYTYLSCILFKKYKNQIAVNIYEEYASNQLKHVILKIALRKIGLCFVTNKKFMGLKKESVFIPDYTYKEEFYSKYVKKNKLDRVVCLGTMNEKKLLIETVEAFNENKYPLYIAGQFESKEKYHYLCKIKNENIIIEDRYIEEDEYYEILGGSKYCILPYEENFYKNRTSGILQESVFLDTIPIAHESLLAFNDIEGIGYKKIDELKRIKIDTRIATTLKRNYGNKKYSIANYSTVKKEIMRCLINEYAK